MLASSSPHKNIAIIGGGPSALFLFKSLLDNYKHLCQVTVFEAKSFLGSGMPYSNEGANPEHITNVSGNEIPPLELNVLDWLAEAPPDMLAKYDINPQTFSEYKVLPRLLFGEYLSAQFSALIARARHMGVKVNIRLNSRVDDIAPGVEGGMLVTVKDQPPYIFDHVVICTGHSWPHSHEGKMKGYYDSPYPPSKLPRETNHPVAIRGSSLTAIDAIRTLARRNGKFEGDDNLKFMPNEDSPDFKIVMHSRSGLLPAVRFHLDDSHLSKHSLLSNEQLEEHIAGNGGFLSLDFIFDKDFKEQIKHKDPDFYDRIKSLSIEEFVRTMMANREGVEPFAFFEGELNQAEKSIRRHQSIYWKEALAILSFAMNYPAKHLSAEDMQRLQHVLMPLISIVIAFVPQSSCRELIALHKAGRLELIAVGKESRVEEHPNGGIVYHYSHENNDEMSNSHYKTYIDCVGQPHLSIDQFPFKGLLRSGSVSSAKIPFRAPPAEDQNNIEFAEQGAFLRVSGLGITDSFRAVDTSGRASPVLYLMAVPFIGGYNPDYSGLDFCAAAAQIIVDDLNKYYDLDSAPEGNTSHMGKKGMEETVHGAE